MKKVIIEVVYIEQKDFMQKTFLRKNQKTFLENIGVWEKIERTIYFSFYKIGNREVRYLLNEFIIDEVLKSLKKDIRDNVKSIRILTK